MGLFPLYFAVKHLFSQPVARLSALLYFVNGFLLRLSGRPIPEMLLIFFLLVSFYFAACIVRQSRDGIASHRNYAACGFFAGLAYLTKPEGFQYFVLLFLFFSVVLLRSKKIKNQLLSLGTFSLIFSVTVLPQISFIKQTTGKWQITTYNRFLFRGFVEPLVSLSPGAPASDPKVEYNYNAYIVRGPYTDEQLRSDLITVRKKAGEYFRSFLTVIGPFSVLFLVMFFIWGKTSLTDKLFVMCWIFPVLTLFFWYATADRFFMVSIPFFIVVQAFLLERLYRTHIKNRSLVIILLAVTFLQSYTPIANHSPTNSVIGNHKKMGEWIQSNLTGIEGSLLADRKPYISFAAKTRYFRYNNIKDYETLIHMLKSNKVDYLVVDDYYTRQKNPGIKELLEGTKKTELELIHKETDGRYGNIFLYKVLY